MIRTFANSLQQAMPVTQQQAAFLMTLQQQETSITSLPESLTKNFAALEHHRVLQH